MAEGAVPGETPMTQDPTGRSLPPAVAELPDVPGAVSIRPDVLRARSEVVAARQRLASEVDQLERSARSAFDIRAKLRSLPDRVREDPARAAAVGGVAAGVAAGATALARRARRPRRHGFLPEDIEDAIARLGKNRDKVRSSLEQSFADYLKERGFEQRSRRGRLGEALAAVAVPAATQVARELLKRSMAPPPDAAGPAASEEAKAAKDASA
ncbi:MAG TPA: hypothetical protein VEY67_10090, partial [Candidatus Dormibacteraeota bacterium]|nr:hypothetical protein [Candidatus Dormibacteraeota bacterium]